MHFLYDDVSADIYANITKKLYKGVYIVSLKTETNFANIAFVFFDQNRIK